MGNEYTDFVTLGVTQGSIPGPNFYNIFTLDVPIPESSIDLTPSRHPKRYENYLVVFNNTLESRSFAWARN